MTTKLLPKTIMPFSLCERQVRLEGALPIAAMSRLRDLLPEQQTAIAVQLQFGKDNEGRSIITSGIQGELILECQRCLQPFACAFGITVVLAIVTSEQAAKSLPSSYEPLLMLEPTPLSVAEMIEEELLLNLPMIPLHQEGQCAAISV